MILRNYLAAILVCLTTICYSQRQSKPFSELYLTPHLGISWQSTATNIHNDSEAPYDFDKNTKGFGLDAGFTLSTNVNSRLQMGINTNGRFRYDYIYGGEGFDIYPKEIRHFLFDYSNSLFVIYNLRKRPDRDWIGAIGFTKNQMGKKDEIFYMPPDEVLLRYQYTSYFFMSGYDLIKLSATIYINTAFTVNYIPRYYPVDGNRYHLNFGLKALVRFKWGKIRLKDVASGPFEKP